MCQTTLSLSMLKIIATSSHNFHFPTCVLTAWVGFPDYRPDFSDIANQTLNIYKQIYPLTSNYSFDVIVTDKGSPTRGTRVTVTYEISNTCILDTWFNYIPSDQVVDMDTGELHASVPGYYSQPYGEFYVAHI